MVVLTADTHVEPFLEVFHHSLACRAKFLKFLLEWPPLVGQKSEDDV
jgi:hypothetical protein